MKTIAARFARALSIQKITVLLKKSKHQFINFFLKTLYFATYYQLLMKITPKPKYDIALIGGGIMSATLATLIHELNPEFKIVIFERLEKVAQESSAAFNNAGTGHSAFCELNYTTEKPDGSIDMILYFQKQTFLYFFTFRHAFRTRFLIFRQSSILKKIKELKQCFNRG